jgi:signal transduction histidine kinase
MAELRSQDAGGKGRLVQSRKTVIGKNGQQIPVALSASIIYEAEKEVATVGVMSDLRERLRIEERLLKTEERLAWSERQALLVELAGTAAHELNQPLTSVMGYAQLLQRQLPPTYSDIHEYTEVLVREAERMAEIVRKIGHITRYETTNYVGGTRILDLDRAILPSAADAEACRLPPESEPDRGEPQLAERAADDHNATPPDDGPLFHLRGGPGRPGPETG